MSNFWGPLQTTLYITPRLLHIKLWRDWWEVHGAFFSATDFLQSIPESLHEWFFDMFAYAHRSEAAKKAVSTILGQHGAFLKGGLLKTELGANFFLNLTEADTETALEFLERTIGKEAPEELLEFTAGRQWIVWALEKIAVERPLFPRAGRLLARLAEAENNPRIGNNATGTFAALFSLGPGRTAPTQAPPPERFPVLQATLNASSKQLRMVALRACDVALTYGHFSRTAGAERRGLTELELWSPRTYEEWFDAYAAVWNLLRKRITALPPDEQQEAARILLQRSHELVRIPELEPDITETISELATLASIQRKVLLENVLQVLEYGNDLPEAVQERWRAIEKQIVGGDDFPAHLRRLVGLPPWRLLQGGAENTQPWAGVAAEAAQNPEQLLSQLSWLMSGDAESAAAFGHELGRADPAFSLQHAIVNAFKEAGPTTNLGLLGGYMRAIHEADPTRWLTLVDDLSKDTVAKHVFPAIIMQSGLTDDAALILTRLVKSGDMPPQHLQGFIFGGEVRHLSVPVFQQWLELLVGAGTPASLMAALRLLHFYYARDQEEVDLPASLIERVLLHTGLFETPPSEARASHLDFDWSRVARQFLKKFPDRKLAVARTLLQNIGTDSVVLQRFAPSYAQGLLTELAKEMPREIWAIAAPLLGPPIDARAYSIKDWLGGAGHFFRSEDSDEKISSILQDVPIEDLWKWVDEDRARRAWYLASFVPKDLLLHPQRRSLVREVLIRYGDREDVQKNLMANFSTEGWMGPESEHYQAKVQRLEQALDSETEASVREWLHRYLRHLRQSIQRARLQEEREDY